MPASTRSGSNTEDDKLVQELNNSKDMTAFADLGKIAQLLRATLSRLDSFETRIQLNTDDITQLKKDNSRLTDHVSRLQEDQIRTEQYSRKDVMTITGLEYHDTETSTELYSAILGMFNRLTSCNFTNKDFVAIHRNGNLFKGNRPPTVTVKFIRFSDKDLFFTKTTRTKCNEICKHVKFHHNMCKPLIDEQKRMGEHLEVKYVTYRGANRHFTVCMNDGNFLNKIRNYNDLQANLSRG